MGLDMYLHAKKYLAGYKHAPADEQQRCAEIVELVGLTAAADPDDLSVEVEVVVGYWRKANAIHRWFVENVQEGVDNCDSYYVSREQLAALGAKCRAALAAAQVAEGQPVHTGTVYSAGQEPEQLFEMGRAALNGEELAKIMPTQSGFFFGGTDYDAGYLNDLEETVKIVDRCLANVPGNVSLYYRSSW